MNGRMVTAKEDDSHACAGGFRGVFVVVVVVVVVTVSFDSFFVAKGLGGILGAASGELPGGSGARRTGWRGVNVSGETLGRETEPVRGSIRVNIKAY